MRAQVTSALAADAEPTTALAGSEPSRRTAALASLVLLVSCGALRFPTYPRSVIDWDESLYLLIAQGWLHGQLPYLTLWDHKPAGLYAVFALALTIFGESTAAPRLMATLFVFASCLLLYWMVRKVTREPRAALATAVLYPAYSLTMGGLSANAEHFFIGSNLLGAALLIRAHSGTDRSCRLRALCAAGLAFGVALQIKYIAAFEAVYFVGCFALSQLSCPSETTRRDLTLGLLALAVMALVPTLLVGGYFFAHGAGDVFIDANFIANLRHSETSRDSAQLAASWWKTTSSWLMTTAPLWMIAGVAWLAGLSRQRSVRFRVDLALLAWIVVGLVEAAATKRFYSHYYIVTFAPLCALSGLAIARLVGARQSFVVGMLALGLCVIPVRTVIDHTYRRWGKEAHEGDEQAALARLIRTQLKPSEYLYVVDEQPILYFLTGARPATRYAFPPHLMTVHFGAVAQVDYQREFALIIQKRPRCVVMRKLGSERAKEFRALLGPEYVKRGATARAELLCR